MTEPMTIERRAAHLPCKDINILEGRVDNVTEAMERVEFKVDKINDSLQALIRIEERQGVMTARLSDGAEKMEGHATRLTRLEAAENRLSGSTRVLVWVVGVAQTIAIGIASAAWAASNNTGAMFSSLQVMDARLESRANSSESRLNMIEAHQK